MNITKAIIPAAGFGTRFLPATKAVPKEMLPVVDKPVIQYVVEEAAAAGITDICIVISAGKEAIREHFSRNALLEAKLMEQGKGELLAAVRGLHEMARFTFVYQNEQKGLGDAIYCGKDFAGGEAVAVLLGDTLIESARPAVGELMEVYRRYGGSAVLCEEVPMEKVSRYGILDCGEEVDEGIWRVREMVEKPSVEEAPSRLAVASRYVFGPEIFNCIERTQRGKGGEIQITDAMRLLLGEERLYGRRLEGVRHDVGGPAGLLQANISLSQGR